MRIDPDVIEISYLSLVTAVILNNDEYSPKEKIKEINLALAKAACKVKNLDALEAERKKIWENMPKKLKFIAAAMSVGSFLKMTKKTKERLELFLCAAGIIVGLIMFGMTVVR